MDHIGNRPGRRRGGVDWDLRRESISVQPSGGNLQGQQPLSPSLTSSLSSPSSWQSSTAGYGAMAIPPLAPLPPCIPHDPGSGQMFYPVCPSPGGMAQWGSYALVPVQCVVMQTGPPIYYSHPAQQQSAYSRAAPPVRPSRPRESRPVSISKSQPQPPTPEQRSSVDCSSISPDSISECGTASASDASQQPASTSWGELTTGILQSILIKLPHSDIKQLRSVCRHWRAAVDQNLEQLTPSLLRARQLCSLFPNLRLLHLTNCSQLRNRDLEILSKSGVRLQTLVVGDDASRPWVTNLGLLWIGKMSSLTSLSLHDCSQVTNRGLSALEQLRGLVALSLRGCDRLTNQGLEALQNNTALTSLNLSGCRKLSDKGLLHLTRLSGLLHLALGNTRIGDEGMEYLAQITSLHELHFANEAVTDQGIKKLHTLTNLQTLALRECAQVSGDALSQLVPQLYNLQSLDLFQSHEFDDSQLAKCLDFLGSVTFLDLRGTEVSDEGIQQLARLQNLQKLCLAPKQEMRVEARLCVVSHLTQLTSLAINNCALGSFALMASLMHLKLLRELDISNCDQVQPRHDQEVAAAVEPVNTHAIEAMAQIQSLTSIDVSRRSVKEEHLATLAERLPRLRTLFVVGCPVLYEQLQTLHRRFPELVIHRKPVHEPTPLSCTSSDLGGQWPSHLNSRVLSGTLAQIA